MGRSTLCCCYLVFLVQVDDGTVPPTSTVRKFLALLEQSDLDFSEELGTYLLKTVKFCLSILDFVLLHCILFSLSSPSFFLPPSLSECQRLKVQVVQAIRSNQQLEQDLDVMDIKIGLLVKNRITLQDVVSTSQQVRHKDKKSNRHSMLLDGSGVGVGGLSKANHEKIEV